MDQEDKKIAQIMASIDIVRRAAPAPFFFTRLEARMTREKGFWGQISSFVARPAYALACICLVLVINASVVLFTSTSDSSGDQQSASVAAVDEYNSVSSTFYDFINSKP